MKEKIKELRRSTGLSQDKFAKALNMPLGTLRNWEQGIAEPAEWVYKLIEFYVYKKR